ncbi:DUF3281 family protein [Francisella tularensis]|uniref:DUF3281 family protein n=1 Tax=Francisella tularensis TaxID=263 RepID=UPI0008F4AF8E|nr:DUF3281 family protein [Francisella tularensis]APA82231.1 hypothetical protein N894_0247 [Francisella tularensis subsp. novicida PA10-7858]
MSKIKKQVLIGAAIVSSAALLGSCGKSETATELRIIDQCNTANTLCKFELANTVLSRYTNALGKTIERVESQTPLQNIQGTITWIPSAGATLANSATVQTEFGSGCENDSCTANANPTAYNLAAGSNSISVSGTVTVNGQTVDLATAVPAVTVETVQVADSHVFPTGNLPEGLTLQALIDGLNANAPAANGTFSADGTNLKITCNTGYEWLDDQNPAYGSTTVSNVTRSTSEVFFDTFNSELTADPGLNAATSNGHFDGGFFTFWIAGCWPVDQP